MEDHIIVPGHFAYSFRYDLPQGTPLCVYHKIERDFVDLVSNIPFISFYLGKIEVAHLTKKLHLQSIVWTPSLLTQQEMQVPRNRVLKSYSYNKNTGKYSFASAKKVVSLAAYCIKDPSSSIISNLSAETLAKLPLWTSQSKFSKSLKKDLERLLAATVYPEMSFPQFVSIYNSQFLLIYKRFCCHRNTYFKEALKYGVIDDETFFEKIGVLKKSNNSSCNFCSYSCENIKM